MLISDDSFISLQLVFSSSYFNLGKFAFLKSGIFSRLTIFLQLKMSSKVTTRWSLELNSSPTLTFLTRLSSVVNNKSRMFAPRVGSLTNCVNELSCKFVYKPCPV